MSIVRFSLLNVGKNWQMDMLGVNIEIDQSG
jgi:hypothetical protein